MTNHTTSSTSQVRGLIRSAGLRATAARIAVLGWLKEAGKPQSHAEVVEGLSDSGFDQSTLFRCLNELAEASLLARLDLVGQVRRFELIDPKGIGEARHAHFMCVDCGELTCLHGYSLEITPEQGRGLKALGQITEVLLRGRCDACADR